MSDNGTVTVDAETGEIKPPAGLPVDSFREAASYLRRPFTPPAVNFKVQAVLGGEKALCIAYIDARLVIERLNLVCPHLWCDSYEKTEGSHMWCHLTVDGITRRDVGEGVGKGLVSDALKRAAVHFGIGVSLYATPKMFMTKADGHLQEHKEDKFRLTRSGEGRCREIYASWLEMNGKYAFGEPLDHGDVLDAVGDSEAEAPVASEGGAAANGEPSSQPSPPPEQLDADRVAEISKGIKLMCRKRPDFDALWGACGLDRVPDGQWNAEGVLNAIRSLTPEQADQVEAALEKRANEAEAQAASAAAEGGNSDG